MKSEDVVKIVIAVTGMVIVLAEAAAKANRKKG